MSTEYATLLRRTQGVMVLGSERAGRAPCLRFAFLLGWAIGGACAGCAGSPASAVGRSSDPDAAEDVTSTAADPASPASPVAAHGSVPAVAAPASPVEPFHLYRAFPGLAGALPRIALATLPTPIERSDAFAASLGIGALYLKRDDRSGPYGGGKVRKLEMYLGEAERSGATRVATIGGLGSNHAVATTLYARARGLDATIFLLSQPPSDDVRENLLAAASHGADLRLVGSYGKAVAALRAEAARGAYAIPVGGSSPLGDVGFVNAGLELADQIATGLVPRPDRIYIPLGTMGSAIGLAIGLAAAGVTTQVVAVRASNLTTSSQAQLEKAYAATVSFLRDRDPTFPGLEYDEAALRIDPGSLGGGYAVPTPAGAEASTLAAAAGLELDPTYGAKAMAALVRDARARRLESSTVVFWVTNHAGEVPPGPIQSPVLPPELRPFVLP